MNTNAIALSKKCYNPRSVWELFLISNLENKIGNFLTENSYLRICSEKRLFCSSSMEKKLGKTVFIFWFQSYHIPKNS